MSPRLLGGGALLLLVVGLAVYGGNSALRVWHMNRALEKLEGEVTTLRTKTEQLSQTVDRLRNDPAVIEQLAREDLGLVREGDTVLKFPSTPR